MSSQDQLLPCTFSISNRWALFFLSSCLFVLNRISTNWYWEVIDKDKTLREHWFTLFGLLVVYLGMDRTLSINWYWKDIDQILILEGRSEIWTGQCPPCAQGWLEYHDEACLSSMHTRILWPVFTFCLTGCSSGCSAEQSNCNLQTPNESPKFVANSE